MSSDSSAVDELLSYFSSVTGCAADRAKFYLDSANWDLSLALSTFYEDPVDEAESVQQPVNPPPSPSDSRELNKRSSNMSRMHTFKDLNKSDGSDSEEEGQRFFAGGSEHSGQQIVGPGGKKKIDTNDLVQSVFEQAKAHGATAADTEGAPVVNTPAFSGTGFRLGAEQSLPSTAEPSQRVTPPRSIMVNLWNNGFTVDDGPLRDYDSPEGRQFLDSIKSGILPQELISLAKGGEVNVDLKDRHHEDYVPPKKTVKAFAGEGHRLGNIDLPTVPTGSGNVDPKACEEEALKEIKFDSTQPSTSVQIRLADGSRLVAKMNNTNTVHDIRRFIVTARPQYAASSFVLLTTFPNKELTEEKLTLAEAKLLGAVVVQRLK